MHYGAFVHYGPGNFFFDQMQNWHTREAANDLLYIYKGKLLTVGHLFTVTEEYGRPRVMTDRERAGFLREMTDTLAQMPRPKPAATPKAAPLDPRPDSFFIKTTQCRLTVHVPTGEPAKRPLVIDCGGPASDGDAYVAKPVNDCTPAVIAGVTQFMIKKYGVDADRVTISQPVRAPIARPRARR
jgi:hypothetical protein